MMGFTGRGGGGRGIRLHRERRSGGMHGKLAGGCLCMCLAESRYMKCCSKASKNTM